MHLDDEFDNDCFFHSCYDSDPKYKAAKHSVVMKVGNSLVALSRIRQWTSFRPMTKIKILCIMMCDPYETIDVRCEPISHLKIENEL